MLNDMQYRSNSGSSSYMSLTASARYRISRSQVQVAYTYGHSIDNQSEPLLGEFPNPNNTSGAVRSSNT